jgi:hypothetical protein
MSRDRERLDRLMGLLRSETASPRDVRGAVMARLVGAGAVRSGASMAWRMGLAMLAVVAIAIGLEMGLSPTEGGDVGAALRRGVERLSPGQPAAGPSRPASPRREPEPGIEIAGAPWREA